MTPESDPGAHISLRGQESTVLPWALGDSRVYEVGNMSDHGLGPLWVPSTFTKTELLLGDVHYRTGRNGLKLEAANMSVNEGLIICCYGQTVKYRTAI